jgi:biotin carboxyl carrier protein
MAEKYLISSESNEITLEFERDDESFRVRRDGAETWKECRLDPIGDSGLYLLMIDNEPTELYLERQRGGAKVTIGRHIYDYAVERWRPALANRKSKKEAQAGVHTITAPMTGSIVEVMRNVGDRVEAGDVALVIESMKMNNELRAPAAGVVESVMVEAGSRVNAGTPLMVIRA